MAGLSPGHDVSNPSVRSDPGEREPWRRNPIHRAQGPRGDIHDDVLAKHVITVPEVRLSPDLKLATCYIMPLGGQDIAAVLKALDGHKRHIRGEIAHKVNLKYAPDLRFRQDESFDEAARIDALLDSDAVRRDTDRKPLRIDQDFDQQDKHDDDD